MENLFFFACDKPNYIVVATVAEYISRWNPELVPDKPVGTPLESTLLGRNLEYVPNIPDVFDAAKMRKLKAMDNIKEVRDILLATVSRAQELSVYFKVPNQQMLVSNRTPLPPSSTPNLLVVTFINFLLLMIEAIVHRKISLSPREKFPIDNLRTQLGFLITFLGDTTMHSQPILTNNILVDIETVVNRVGSFIFSYVFTLSLHTVVVFTQKRLGDQNKANIEDMRNELGIFLCSILNKSFQDHIPLRMEEINNTMAEIKDLVHKLQSFIYFFLATENEQVHEDGILDLALSNLVQKFELLNTKIKEHCVQVSKLPSDDMAPKTSLVSLFIVDSVLDDVMYFINSKSHETDDVEDQILRLHGELMLLGSSINKIAEKQQTEHEELVMRTRDIAYEVEFVINSLSPVWYLTIRLPQLIEKILHIKSDVEEAKAKTDTAGETQTERFSSEQASLQSKQTQVVENDIVGFKQVEKQVMEQLVGGTKHRQIISISGMPGLGKTTFANKLYNHPSTVKHFDCRAWCVCSQIHNKRDMLIDILMSLGHLRREDVKEDENLGEKVYKSIKERRYLLVIDDMWDINAWNDLKAYFPDDETGSRILFTTRNKEVGSEASASVMKELPFLSDDQCWELLQMKVFQGENCPQEVLDIGKKIATKCGGLPLAVVVIAGVLVSMEMNEHLWKKIESNISLHIATSPHDYMQILELSYKHLPIHLKPCFLYFGAFKEDMEIQVQMLTSMWIAQGFIKKEEGKSLEDVALEYLMKLIDRSMVLVSKRGSNGHIKTCKIHDLLLDMCSRIAEENYIVKKVDSNHDRALYHQHHSVRFFCDQYNFANYIPPFGLPTRSLLCDYAWWPMLFSCGSKALKVLHCDGDSTLEPAIGTDHLVHLRYLSTISTSLPAIENCQRLEFLAVKTIYHQIEITEVLLNMVNLRHMHFERGAHFSKSCRRKATDDKNFKINNKVLQSISMVKIADEIDEKILRCFPNLRSLEAKLKGSFKFSFDFLHQLESLKLRARVSNFISLPSNLKCLTLCGIKICREQMEMIERLEYLEVLTLEFVHFEGEQWDTSECAFPELKVLELKFVQVSTWNSSSDTFSSLQQLVLRRCHILFVIPSSFGDILTLQKIELIECPQRVKQSAKEIENYQKEMGNEELQVIESDSF